MAAPFIAPIGPHAFGRVVVEVDTANANFDGSGTIVTVRAIPATEPNGVLVRKVTIKALEATTVGQVALYLSNDAGTTWFPWRAILVSAATPAAGVAAFEAQLDDVNDAELANGLHVPSGWAVGASTFNAEDMQVHLEYGVM